MERKTKQRILGLFVFIGLIAILLPFFQTNKELPSEKMLVKAPPFPDQATQMAQDGVTPDEIQSTETVINQSSSANSNNRPQLDDTINVKTTPVAINTPSNNTAAEAKETKTNIADNNTDVKNKSTTPQLIASEPVASTDQTNALSPESNLQNKTLAANQTESKDKSTKDNDINKTSNRPSLSPEESNDDDTEIAAQKPVKNKETVAPSTVSNSPINTKHMRTAQTNKPFVPKVIEYQTLVAPLKSSPITSDGLSRLKNAAWVIQLGSFKSKTNAIQLVNQLRAKGYRAFIQQVSTPVGNTTRVFVGPELKQEHARKTAEHIASSLRLRGIVINYKPLAL